MAGVTFADVGKRYGTVEAVRSLSLEIADGEFMVLVGPSGSGKTTALRMLAGLESITSGQISIGEREVNKVAPRERDIAMVFQDYALYPQMTVFDNLAFGLRRRKVPASRDHAAGASRPRACSGSSRSWRGGRGSCPAARRSASPSGARWCAIRRSS